VQLPKRESIVYVDWKASSTYECHLRDVELTLLCPDKALRKTEISSHTKADRILTGKFYRPSRLCVRSRQSSHVAAQGCGLPWAPWGLAFREQETSSPQRKCVCVCYTSPPLRWAETQPSSSSISLSWRGLRGAGLEPAQKGLPDEISNVWRHQDSERQRVSIFGRSIYPGNFFIILTYLALHWWKKQHLFVDFRGVNCTLLSFFVGPINSLSW